MRDASSEKGRPVHISLLPDDVLARVLRGCFNGQQPGAVCSAAFLRYTAKSGDVPLDAPVSPPLQGFSSAPLSVCNSLKAAFGEQALAPLPATLVCRQWHRVVHTQSVVHTLATLYPASVPQSVQTLLICVTKEPDVPGLVTLLQSHPALTCLVVCRQVGTTYTTAVFPSNASVRQDWQIRASETDLLHLRHVLSTSSLRHLTLPALTLPDGELWVCEDSPSAAPEHEAAHTLSAAHPATSDRIGMRKGFSAAATSKAAKSPSSPGPGAMPGLPTTLRSLSLFSDSFLCSADAPALAQLTALHVAETDAQRDDGHQTIVERTGPGTALQSLCIMGRRLHAGERVCERRDETLARCLEAASRLSALTQLILPCTTLRCGCVSPEEHEIPRKVLTTLATLTALQDLRFVADLALRSSALFVTRFPVDITPLSSLVGLTRLHIHWAEKDFKLALPMPPATLGSLESLQNLEFAGLQAQGHHLRVVSSLTRLTAFSFSNNQSDHDPYVSFNARALSYLPDTLRELRLRSLRHVLPLHLVALVRKQQELRLLHLGDIKPRSPRFPDCATAAELAELYRGVLLAVSPSLQRLELDQGPEEDSVDTAPLCLEGLPCLEVLRIARMHFVSALRLEQLPCLMSLQCLSCHALKELYVDAATTAALRSVRCVDVSLYDTSLIPLGFRPAQQAIDAISSGVDPTLLAGHVYVTARSQEPRDAMASLPCPQDQGRAICSRVDPMPLASHGYVTARPQESTDAMATFPCLQDPNRKHRVKPPTAEITCWRGEASEAGSSSSVGRESGQGVDFLDAPSLLHTVILTQAACCSEPKHSVPVQLDCVLRPSPNLRRLELAYVDPDEHCLLTPLFSMSAFQHLHTCSALTYLALSEPSDASPEDVTALARAIRSMTRLETLCLYSWPQLGAHDVDVMLYGLTRLRAVKMISLVKLAQDPDAPERLAACLCAVARPALQEVHFVTEAGCPMVDPFTNGWFVYAVSAYRDRAINVTVKSEWESFAYKLAQKKVDLGIESERLRRRAGFRWAPY